MVDSQKLRTVTVTRYITPLREGGSLPALTEADDGFKYVLKFRGAGHGVKALIAELLGGVIACKLGLKVPELVFVELDEIFGKTEGDEEIQDLLRFSKGLNLALHFLSGALTFEPSADNVDEYLASKIVWLDGFITNVDRTFKNTNMLIWHKELWLIDHGAAFYFHHSFINWEKSALNPFIFIKDHVLLPQATLLSEVDKEFKTVLDKVFFRDLVNLIPEEWLQWQDVKMNSAEIREVYYNFLVTRFENSHLFINEAKRMYNGDL